MRRDIEAGEGLVQAQSVHTLYAGESLAAAALMAYLSAHMIQVIEPLHLQAQLTGMSRRVLHE